MVVRVGSARPEAQDRVALELHLRHDDVVVGAASANTVVVGAADDGVRTAVVPVEGHAIIVIGDVGEGGKVAPVDAVTVRIDEEPIARDAALEAFVDAF